MQREGDAHEFRGFVVFVARFELEAVNASLGGLFEHFAGSGHDLVFYVRRILSGRTAGFVLVVFLDFVGGRRATVLLDQRPLEEVLPERVKSLDAAMIAAGGRLGKSPALRSLGAKIFERGFQLQRSRAGDETATKDDKSETNEQRTHPA